MGIPEGLLNGMAPKGLPDKPTVTPEIATQKAQEGTQETSAGYTARRFGAAFGEGLGAGLEAGALSSSLPETLIQWFLPPELADKLFPGTAEKRKAFYEGGLTFRESTKGAAAKLAGKVVRALGGETPITEEVGRAPGAISKFSGNVAEFVGAGLSRPMPGAYGPKGILGLMGSGIASETAGEITESAMTSAGASPEATEQAGTVARFGGAMVGNPLNIVRGNAVMAPLKGVTKGAKDFYAAGKAALNKEKGDPRGMLQIFGDHFTGLRAETKGALQHYVNEQIAHDIALDPNAPMALKEFEDAVKATGADPTKFNIAQATGTPSLVGTLEQYRPKTPEQVEILASKDKAGQAEIKRVFNIGAGKAIDPNAPGKMAALRDYKKVTLAQLSALDKEAATTAAQVRPLSTEQAFTQGTELGAKTEQQVEALRTQKNALYSEAAAKADELKTLYDTTPAITASKEILGATLSKLDPKTAPDTISRIKSLFVKGMRSKSQDFEKMAADMPPEVKQWFTEDYSKKTGVTLRELYDAKVAISNEMNMASRSTDQAARIQEQNLSKLRTEIDKIIDTQSPEAVKAANANAEQYFREQYAPATKGAINKKMAQDTNAFFAQERIDPAARIPTYLSFEGKTGRVSETNMQEFDKLYSGATPGTQRVPEAYAALERGLEDKYRQANLLGGAEGFSRAKHEKFLREYEAALARTPELGNKFNNVADNLERINLEAKNTQEHYQKIVNSSLTDTVDIAAANRMIANAITDPQKMGRLIGDMNKKLGNKAGAKMVIKEIWERAQPFKATGVGDQAYDAEKLLKVLQEGGGTAERPGGLKVAFRAAFGKEAGDKHFANLRMLGLLAQRQALTSPRYLRPMEPFPPDILKYKVGQSGASIITSYKAMAEGRTSAAWFSTQWASRYFNMRVQDGFVKAQQEALFNPQMADDIIKLSGAMQKGDKLPAGPVTRISSKMGDVGKEWAKDLLEHGQITKHMARGAAVQTAVLDSTESDEKKREASSTLPLGMR